MIYIPIYLTCFLFEKLEDFSRANVEIQILIYFFTISLVNNLNQQILIESFKN